VTRKGRVGKTGKHCMKKLGNRGQKQQDAWRGGATIYYQMFFFQVPTSNLKNMF